MARGSGMNTVAINQRVAVIGVAAQRCAEVQVRNLEIASQFAVRLVQGRQARGTIGDPVAALLTRFRGAQHGRPGRSKGPDASAARH